MAKNKNPYGLSEWQIKAAQEALRTYEMNRPLIERAQQMSEAMKAFEIPAGTSQLLKQAEHMQASLEQAKLQITPMLQISRELEEQRKKMEEALGPTLQGLASMQEQYQTIMADALKYQEQWKELISPIVSEIGEAAFVANEQFKEIGRYAGEAFRAVAEAIPPSVFEDFKRIVLDPERLKQRFYQRDFFCISFGWPPLRHVPIITVTTEEVLQEHSEEEARRLIDEEIVEAHGEDVLEKMLADWKDCGFLKDRLPILSAVIDAHIRGEYWLTVPALLPQIEGVLLLARKQPKHEVTKEVRLIFQGKDNLIRGFLLEKVYSSVRREDELPFDLLRHPILHGYHLSYGTKVTSLKVILLFDYIVDSIKQLREEEFGEDSIED